MKKWHEINMSWGKFLYSPFCKPGILIAGKDEDSEDFLWVIGTINTMGGCCEHCDDFAPSFVIKYQDLLTEKEREKLHRHSH